ncbi:MAG: CvpA family protein [Panacagrimonas sp.]
MNWADYGILAIVVLSALIGLLRGFTREIFGLGTWVFAVILSIAFGREAMDVLQPHIATPLFRTGAAYGGLFLAGLLVGAIITAVIVAQIRGSRFSSADRTLGSGLGLIRGVLVVGLVVLLARTNGMNQTSWWKEAMLVGPSEPIADGLDILIPDHWLAPLKPDASGPAESKPDKATPAASAALV